MMTLKERPTGIVQVNDTVVDISTPGPEPEGTIVASPPEPTIEAPPEPPAPQNFRTDSDRKRSQSAATVVTRMQTAVAEAEAALSQAEAVCVADPNAKGAFEKARAARKSLDDATRDLSLATAHAAKVEAEIVATERAAMIAAAKAKSASLSEFVTDEERAIAVRIGVLLAELAKRLDARAATVKGELAEIAALHAATGLPLPYELQGLEVPGSESHRDLDSWASSKRSREVSELADFGSLAQARSGFSPAIKTWMPAWDGISPVRVREAEGKIGNALTGLLRNLNANTPVATLATKAAAVVGLGVVAALTMAGR